MKRPAEGRKKKKKPNMVTSASRSSGTCNSSFVSAGLLLRTSIVLPSGTASALALHFVCTFVY